MDKPTIAALGALTVAIEIVIDALGEPSRGQIAEVIDSTLSVMPPDQRDGAGGRVLKQLRDYASKPPAH